MNIIEGRDLVIEETTPTKPYLIFGQVCQSRRD